MKLNNNKISYFIVYSPKPNTGVYFKVHGLLNAAKGMGYVTELVDKPRWKFTEFIALFCEMVKCDSKYIFLRDILTWHMLFSFPFLLICRIQGKKLIDDIPTPCRSALTEIVSNSRLHPIKGFILRLLLILKGPFPYWFFNVLIQYGNEGVYFAMGNKRKTIMLGNGIEKERINLRSKEYLNHDGELHVITVANLQISHGVDRIVRAVSLWNNTNEQKVYFHIVSGNAAPPVFTALQKLVKDLDIEQYIIFEPQKNVDQLLEMYGKCDLAIGAIGIHRVGLYQSSALKLREYCMAGIPFVFSGSDPDFPIELPFCFNVSNDEDTKDIIRVFHDFPSRRSTFTDEDIRQFAIDNLNYTRKLQRLGF